MATSNGVSYPVIEVLRKRHGGRVSLAIIQFRTDICSSFLVESAWDRHDVSLDVVRGVDDPSDILLGDFDLSLMYAVQPRAEPQPLTSNLALLERTKLGNARSRAKSLHGSSKYRKSGGHISARTRTVTLDTKIRGIRRDPLTAVVSVAIF